MSTPKDIDAAAKAVQKPGTLRVSLQDIQDNIAMVLYTSPRMCLGDGGHDIREGVEALNYRAALDTMTICYVVLRNGFIVVGKTAPADPDNFNAELGRRFALDNAIAQIWPLMGYDLRQQLYHETQLLPDR